MKVNVKKCRGTGKAKGYGCGSPQLVRRYGLGTLCKCYHSWLLNTPAGKLQINKAKISGKKKLTKEQAHKFRQLKIDNKSIYKLKQEARAPFQLWIRKRDSNLACISCGNITAELWDAGHYYKAELYSGLIFDEINVNKQCKYCNLYREGNESGYRLGLLKKYGIKVVSELDKRAIELRSYRYSREELLGIKNIYKLKLKANEN